MNQPQERGSPLPSGALPEVAGTEHWTNKRAGAQDVHLFLWRKRLRDPSSDGIASFEDLAAFFAKLPNPDKQFIVMPGIAHSSTRSKNWALVYHLLDAFFSRPAPVYTG